MLVLVLLSGLALALGQEPPLVHVDRATLRIQCPAHAVCADFYTFLRYGRPERRAVYNCHCPGQEGRCQLDDSKMLYDTIKHKMYICESLDTVEQCAEDEPEQVAEQIVRHSDDFAGNSYVELKCQCPRHHNPVEPEAGHIEKATRWSGNSYEEDSPVFYQSYVCARERREYFNRFRPDLRGHSGK